MFLCFICTNIFQKFNLSQKMSSSTIVWNENKDTLTVPVGKPLLLIYRKLFTSSTDFCYLQYNFKSSLAQVLKTPCKFLANRISVSKLGSFICWKASVSKKAEGGLMPKLIYHCLGTLSLLKLATFIQNIHEFKKIKYSQII